MKIIIAGAGAVGKHLAKLLSREKHNIIVMDDQEERLSDLSSNLDLLTIKASPSSISELRNAGVGKADLFIGVTPDEAHNITCCMLASRLGAKKTLARVDNYEYTLPENREFFKTMGISSVIYPEVLAGKEIIHNIRHSWVRLWLELKDGKLILLGVKMRPSAHILGKQLKDLFPPGAPCLVVAVMRGEETLILHGNDSLEEDDVVYFLTTPDYVPYIREMCGKEDYPDVHTVYIMGGSDTAVHAVHNMPDYMNAKVFEPDPARCMELNSLLDGTNSMVLNSNGPDCEQFTEEGLSSDDAFAALSDSSEANILACLSAKRVGVVKTVAMVENSDYIKIAEHLDIGYIINKKTFAASHIYQMMLKADVTTVKNLIVANADVAEFQVTPGAKVTKHDVKDLHLPPTVTLGALVREGKCSLVNGRTRLQAGDTVVAFCLENAISRLEKFF
jgi:trk system potassium uptake protein TrkA